MHTCSIDKSTSDCVLSTCSNKTLHDDVLKYIIYISGIICENNEKENYLAYDLNVFVVIIQKTSYSKSNTILNLCLCANL